MQDKLQKEAHIIELKKIQKKVESITMELEAQLDCYQNKIKEIKKQNEIKSILDYEITDIEYVNGIKTWSKFHIDAPQMSSLEESIHEDYLGGWSNNCFVDMYTEQDYYYKRVYDFLMDKEQVLSVEKLDLSLTEGIKYIPEEVTYFKNLKTLVLPDEISFLKIPIILLNFPSLYHLQLVFRRENNDYRHMSGFDFIDTFIPMKNITKLSLNFIDCNNDIPDINLEQLTHLEIHFNYWNSYVYDTCTLPKSLFKLPNLKSLSIVAFGEDFRLEEREDGMSYNHETQNFLKIPDAIGDLDGLESLTISAPIDGSCLPSAIGKLQNLRKLDLSRSDLSLIPDTINELSNLEYLDLSENRIEDNKVNTSRLTKLTKYICD
jgi:Leucine-rich repeat (LRR) protein